MFNLFRKKKIEILAPVNGEVINITSVDDEAFKEKMLGDGLAIVPTSNEFYAPMAGTITSLFPTKHAYGIKHKSNVECLLHIGLETVALNGRGFNSQVAQGDKVKAQQLLAVVDWEEIDSDIKSRQTPLIFLTESLGNKRITNIKIGPAQAGDVIATIE